jgi:putative ABC transport system ATP-binding protein
VIVEELVNVCKEYPMVKALCEFSLQIKKGELILVMGPSGSGKSTFLHLAGLLDAPTSGKVMINGKDVPDNENRRAKLRSQTMGFIFQDFGLIPSLTALDNILLPTVFAGKDFAQRAYKISETLGLTKRLSHYPKQLSGGEKQRVAIARSLVNDPQIIFADEPTGNLDSKTGDQVMKLLRSLADLGKAVIVVSHNPDYKVYADKIVLLKDGKMI